MFQPRHIRAIQAVGERQQLAFGFQFETGVGGEELFDLLGVFLGLRYGGEALKRQGQGGTIISTASIGTSSSLYLVVNAAVMKLTQEFASALERYKIRVEYLQPAESMLEKSISYVADQA